MTDVTPPPLLHRPVFGADLLIHALAKQPDAPAVNIGDRTMTAREMAAQVSRYSQAFRARGLGQGAQASMLSLNRPEVLFTMGANQVNATRSTPLHPMGSVEDQAYVLTDCGATALIFDPDTFTDRARQLSEMVPGIEHFLALGPTEFGEDLTALAAGFEPQPLVAPVVDPDALAGIAYSGGTTGKPKGIMGSYQSQATMTQIQMAEWQWPDETRFLICTPLSHAGAAFFVPTLLRGGSLTVLPGFDPETFMRTVEEKRITSTMLVPTMLYVLLDHPKFDQYDLSSLQTVFYGASAASPTRLAEAVRRMGPIFFQFYGQAECPMTITVLRKEDHDPSNLDRLASCGRPVPWVHVALLDDDGNEVAPGEPGEICVRSPMVMKGYLGKPEQTAEAFAHGWLHTGDVARADDEGFLYIVDRKKDMIVTGGFNVYPREVEDVISTHPAVSAVAVIGVPDERWGESVKAVVVPRPGVDLDTAELIDLVKEHKGSVQAPKSVDLVDAIPLSALGKPDKKALRARYWGESGRMVN
ncbi:AMP-binding protein [Rhabdothermincola salaria]|uniref:AMP-binding protein n=1 Tax=Rhabdothermincola salaria TaxID=2903142 RepID=UPI001E2EA37E|nr:AMP-binding protein [Rhabdothermincola salaria]MCD9624839.1 AMP-binding protein [Rhabdothermincola salaria]